MSPAELAQRIAELDWSATSLQHQLAVGAARDILSGKSNVVALPTRPRARWTTIHHLDGREWASSTHFAPGTAWDWVVDTVMQEHGVSEEQVSSLEGSEEQYDGDDLVTIDGVAVYRLQHSVK